MTEDPHSRNEPLLANPRTFSKRLHFVLYGTAAIVSFQYLSRHFVAPIPDVGASPSVLRVEAYPTVLITNTTPPPDLLGQDREVQT